MKNGGDASEREKTSCQGKPYCVIRHRSWASIIGKCGKNDGSAKEGNRNPGKYEYSFHLFSFRLFTSTRLTSVCHARFRGLTNHVTGAAPAISNMKQQRHRGVECSDFVSCHAATVPRKARPAARAPITRPMSASRQFERIQAKELTNRTNPQHAPSIRGYPCKPRERWT